jgi:hypothetical protein
VSTMRAPSESDGASGGGGVGIGVAGKAAM